MKQITLNIEENKFKTFLNFIKTLDYVALSEETEIPLEQQDEVNRRIKLMEEGKLKKRTWDEAKNDIFK